MQVGQHVRFDTDDWSLLGKVGELVDEYPVPGSTQASVMVEGRLVAVSRREIIPTCEPLTPRRASLSWRPWRTPAGSFLDPVPMPS